MSAQQGMPPKEPSSPAAMRDVARLPFRIIRPAAAFLAGLRGVNALDVTETDDMYHVRAVLPGLDPSEIEISAQGRTITINADRVVEDERPRGSYLRRESRSIRYHRALTLPEPVRADDARACYERGVLEITLPKAETGPLKRIAVASTHADTEA